jgi:hypothetical protein
MGERLPVEEIVTAIHKIEMRYGATAVRLLAINALPALDAAETRRVLDQVRELARKDGRPGP